VRPASYHDAWLSEGFANFCALWYLQAGRHDADTYLATLGLWRDLLLQNRRFLLGAGQQAGPVWLGGRTNSSTTEDDYGVIVYRKGAWVLHMLRNLLLDPDTGDETRFRTLLHGFHEAHRNGFATTGEFRAAAEAAAGEDLGWFFAQWVYGTDVPTYHWSWEALEKTPGQWVVRGHVRQSNVPDAFRAPVLVRVDFGGGRFARTRVWLQGPETTFDLPSTSERPLDVRFNDLESVLAEVVRAK
jgi:aminopeptidase N